jgi:hypothetical protein
MFKKISTTGLAIFMFTLSIYAADSMKSASNCKLCKDGLKKEILDFV